MALLPEPYQKFYHAALCIIPASRLFCDPLRTLAYGIDASFYRMIPKLVVKLQTREELAQVLQISTRLQVPVTFRTAGTSLSGQAITDSVLLVLQGSWQNYTIHADGTHISLEPGIVGAEANYYLQRYARKIGPDPASIDHAMIGGIAANNSSGMCCGTADNSYKTVAGIKLILQDGTLLDTADTASCLSLHTTHPNLIAAITQIRAEIMQDSELAELITRKYKIKNTMGYSLNAFVDYSDPIAIIEHLMIGSEGTLGFIAEITFATIPDYVHKASALIIYPAMSQACLAVMQLDRDIVAAAELMDRISLKSVEDKPGMPPYLKTLSADAAALLVEVRAEDAAALAQAMAAVKSVLAVIPTELPLEFTDIKAEYDNLWNIRKGIFPAVGAMRRLGTGVIIEDVAFPKEHLAAATLDLRHILNKHGYNDAIIYGHALDGNLHFVFTQDFGQSVDLPRYEALMQDVGELVVSTYHGSLKAEHGTGRNMAPFVELEWGAKAYDLMCRIKQAFDPNNLLNPGVIINDNPNVYLENLKGMPQAHTIIDRCTNCGFCQVICPSKNLTLTPRQRIVVQREIAELKRTGQDPVRLRRLESDYVYLGDATCATDGLCATTCPLSINTGNHVKYLRSQHVSPTAVRLAASIATNMQKVTGLTRFGLKGLNLAHSVLGTSAMTSLSGSVRKLSSDRLPQWNPWMPACGFVPPLPAKTAGTKPKVVYFPSCISRSMGPAKADIDQRSLSEAVVAVLIKAGYEVIYPPDMHKLCCGMPFASKGFIDIADAKSSELEKSLLTASNNGAFPILCDTSPCLYRMHQVLDQRLNLFDPVEFTHDFLLNRLEFTRVPETVAVHVTCSATKMGLRDKFKRVAEACATNVVLPYHVSCCGFAGDRGFTYPELNASALAALQHELPEDCHSGYSNSRTCEIGLSLHSGISYQSIMYLVDRCTHSKGY
ncbi:MAG: FAD-binding and (Fe-S)-binding domain-containing protein [Peptococcaceae bacterium]|nr:FAD-binding and (Fe-S)-binding domain-containing protein [Peptococcaceae bacterium]